MKTKFLPPKDIIDVVKAAKNGRSITLSKSVDEWLSLETSRSIEPCELLDITKKMISDHFPELLNITITVEFVDLKDQFLQYGHLAKDEYYIDVDNSFINAPIEAIMGGLAHELSHIVLDMNRNFIDTFLYNYFKLYRRLDERNTDLEILIRGYSKELNAYYEFENTLEKTALISYDGLSHLELKKIFNKKEY